MDNPRFFFRVDGKVPETHSMLGYQLPFDYENIFEKINLFSEGVNWKTIQIKIVPSLMMDKNKIIIISNEFKHMNAPIEHSVVYLDEKSKSLIASSETLEGLFDEINKI